MTKTCSAHNQEDTIKLVSLDEREGMLLSSTGAYWYFVYDIYMDAKYPKIESWVECYEYGELVKVSDSVVIHEGSPVSAKKGNLVFTLNRAFVDEGEQIYMSNFSHDGGSNRSWTYIQRPTGGGSFQIGLNEKERIIADEPIMIAVVAGGGNSIVNYDEKVFEGDHEEFYKVLKNDYVQIFYLRFNKEL
ncbi:hypothetical protein GGQ84_001551 [Desulfitispora alkaliphila]|uniref:hypothetical protein n=1 Tax=Desulfitispora alkaliphila TaxID=622674 RepID=UPI003D218D70